MKILIVEDEIKLAGFIADGLKGAGHICDIVNDGIKALENAMTGNYDLILLDLMLPAMSGFELITNLKSLGNNTPVVILSALSDKEHVIKGLDLGAADYLKKPFDLDELLARVRAVQRRTIETGTLKLAVEDLQVDLLKREVRRGGNPVILSNREFGLLEFLLANANKVVTKAQMLDKVWDINFDPGSNVVEVHLYQLRKKMDRGFNKELIHTVIGRGYTLKGEVLKG